MTNRTFRLVNRWIHIFGVAILGTYIYSPWSDIATFQAAVQWLVIPVLGISGIAMWMQKSRFVQNRMTKVSHFS